MRLSLLALLVAATSACADGANPIARHLFTADPAALVVGDRLYVYTSHDEADSTYFDMWDWRLFSTADLGTWQDHGPVFDVKGFAWARHYAWAPDVLAANGKYWLFLPVDRTKIGVAVGDSPTGPFRDAIGAPLIDAAAQPDAGPEPIDPALFRDDDGITWMFFGCRQPMVAKLDASLTRLDGPLHRVDLLDPEGNPILLVPKDVQPALPMGYGEAPYLFKRAGRYYFVYSNGWAKDSTLVYATGTSPAGPFTYQGEVMKRVPCVTHHGSVVEFCGKWYIFYHTSELSGGNVFRRNVRVDELTFAEDGQIVPVVATARGPAPLASEPLTAATALTLGTPASTNVRGADFPRVLQDRRVVFRIKAPKAQSVKFHVEKTYAATRDADGFWTAIADVQVPGLHFYWLVIDDVWVADPASETFYGTGKPCSGIEIPEAGEDYAEIRAVPHGDMRERHYFSVTTQGWRRLFVYTPPGYDASGATRYPVIYLQHGGGEDERAWVAQGRVANILDNLIAGGKACPMLVVMGQGYARRPGEPEVPLAPPAGLFEAKPRGDAVRSDAVPPDFSRMFSALDDEFVRDLIPFVDATWRTIPDSEHRAIAGFSMGGMQAFLIGLGHSETFSAIGGFSGAGGGFGDGRFDPKTYLGGVFADPAAFNAKKRFLFIGLGAEEPPRILAGVRGYRDALAAAGIQHVYFESPGSAHEWLTCRRALHAFVPRLFR